MKNIRYINCKIYLDNNEIIQNGAVEICDGIIKNILKEYKPQDGDIDLKHNILIPGFIDLQCNGGFGVSFLGADKNKMQIFDDNIFKTGCTTYFATLITDIPERYNQSIIQITDYLENNPNSPCYAIHLEGPFLNPEKKGAHNEKYIIHGTLKQFQKYESLGKGRIKEITFAPEKTDIELCKYLKKQNILMCAGHSMAKYSDILEFSKEGLISCTHLFNAMANFNHQDPNLAEAFLNEKSLYCQIICDKYHVHSNVISMVWKLKGSEKMILITDAIEAMGCPNGDYMLGTLPIVSKNGRVFLKSNEKSLAGSALTMIQAFKNAYEILNCSIHDLIKMTATNPAKIILMEDKLGTISKNKIANFVVLDHKLELVHTIFHGNIIYSN